MSLLQVAVSPSHPSTSVVDAISIVEAISPTLEDTVASPHSHSSPSPVLMTEVVEASEGVLLLEPVDSSTQEMDTR